MRRKDREITDFNAMKKILQDCGCCRLGLVEPDGTACILPLNFGWEEQNGTLTLWFHGAAEGHKFSMLRPGAVVGFEMDTGHRLVPGPKAEEYTYAYRSVMGRGEVTFARDDGAKLHGLNCIMNHYSGRSDWTVTPAMLGVTAVYSLRVTAWTAKEHKIP